MGNKWYYCDECKVSYTSTEVQRVTTGQPEEVKKTDGNTETWQDYEVHCPKGHYITFGSQKNL